MPIIGAHVSASISLELSFERAENIGAQCTQIFISPPQQWVQSNHSPEEIKKYLAKQRSSGIGPNFIHGTYLVNLGTADPAHLQKSIDWLIYALNMSAELEIEGIIFHLGSHKGLGFDAVKNQVVKAISNALSNSSTNSKLILENSAGMGGSIGSKFQEVGWIIKQVKDPRVKVCVDTQHSFAAGYDVKTPIGLKSTLEEFDEEIGLSNLSAVHANNSKIEFRGGKDRHENIGEGFIGIDGFENIMSNPAFKDIPFLLEVPGFSAAGPDKENVDLLKSLIRK